MVSITGILGLTTGVLGTYNLARWGVTRAVKARRRVKAARELYSDIKSIRGYVKKIKSGEVDKKALRARVAALLNDEEDDAPVAPAK